MAGSPKRTRKTARESKAERPIQMIVRRGATPRFEALKQKTKHLNVEVVWDRRESDGTDPALVPERERPFIERRRRPPFTWDLADFVVVVPEKSASKRSK